jgi:UDP-glucuronate 4-epimerase
MKILVTGNAGFIGFHVVKALLLRGDCVVGIDSVNDYYDIQLKLDRLEILRKLAIEKSSNYIFIKGNIADTNIVNKCFNDHSFDRVIHLAAQAGVRYSIENPLAYVESNILGFTNIIEACRRKLIPHLTYASTSSVYGANTKVPFKEEEIADHPIQFYAATKRANELMAHSYSHLFQLPTTGLRFFTVYGPWGRPDMAIFLFTKKILNGEPIDLYNLGKHTRDFTFIDDIVQGIIKSSDNIATSNENWNSENPDPSSSKAPFRIFNIGNSSPATLIEYLEAIEISLGIKANKNLLPLQPGDVIDTFADVQKICKKVGYKPSTNVVVGVEHFVNWYKFYYKIK